MPESDLDILCEVYQFPPFLAELHAAFALEGDPYQALLDLCGASDQDLRKLIERR